MEEKQSAELRKFINTITDKKVQPFIDLAKLHNSGIYNLAVQMAIEHATKYGDLSFVNLLFTLMDGTPHGAALVSSLRPKLNFILTDTKPRKLKKASAEQVAQAAKKAQSKPITVKPMPAKPAKKKDKPKVSHDLMDSRLMLPGSYGTGKRR